MAGLCFNAGFCKALSNIAAVINSNHAMTLDLLAVPKACSLFHYCKKKPRQTLTLKLEAPPWQMSSKGVNYLFENFSLEFPTIAAVTVRRGLLQVDSVLVR